MKAEDMEKMLDEIIKSNRLLEDTQASNAIRLIAGYCDTHGCGSCAIAKACEQVSLVSFPFYRLSAIMKESKKD